jgi:hypothetical protein
VTVNVLSAIKFIGVVESGGKDPVESTKLMFVPTNRKAGGDGLHVKLIASGILFELHP